ncbi:hypothetical protein ILYODFUR_029419 [Ilyodon furcidens]|uniref:Uncharacterized protein n=1 Tax=Ilyodon furcidens TaxID=33524 RepID=A0ABV0VIL9_9TELE
MSFQTPFPAHLFGFLRGFLSELLSVSVHATMDPAFASACAPASVGQPSTSPSADQPSSLLSSPGQPSSLLLSCQGSRTTLPSSSVGLSLPRVPLWVQVLYAWRQFFWTFLKGIWDLPLRGRGNVRIFLC